MGWTGKSVGLGSPTSCSGCEGRRADGGVQFHVLGWARISSGFEFTCEKADRLLTMVHENRKFGLDTVYLPGSDPWRTDGIECIGYSEIGVSEYLHLDFATSDDKAGLCRVYQADKNLGRWHGAIKGPAAYLSNDVYKTVAKRVLAHGIKLENFISTAQVGGTVLDGVTFTPSNYEGLAQAVQKAKRNGGVIEGKTVGPKDAIDLSFMATTGTGFREISYTEGQQWSLDFSALHFALSPLSCNIHIDEFGVVLSTADGRVSLSPNALHHIGNELILKTIIKEFLHQKIKLPRTVIDHLFFEGPNAANGFRKMAAASS